VAERACWGEVSAQRRQAITKYFRALSEGNFEGLREVCSSEVRYLLPGDVHALSTEILGLEAFVAHAREIFGRFVAAAFEVEAVLPLPGGAVARYQGSWGEGGQRQSLPGAVVFHFDGERISQVGVRLNLSALGRVAPAIQ
jgi:ketosteroid isomerase-like protein